MTHRSRTQRLTASLVMGALLTAALPAMASAQSTSRQMNGLKLSNDQPIQIESDQLEIRDAERKAFFTGNVKVVQGATTLQAGTMTVLYKGENAAVTQGNADIDKIDVDGKVFLSSGTQQATAEKGRFDLVSQVFVLEGERVVLSEGQNVFVGCKLTVQMATGQAKLDSCGRRVQIQLDPKSQKQ